MNERILANVGGMPISDRDVDEFLAELGERGKAYNTPEGRKRILEQLIDNKLFLLDARRNLLEAEPEFKAQLAKLRDRLLINYNAERAFSSITVSDAEAEKYYNARDGERLAHSCRHGGQGKEDFLRHCGGKDNL